MTAWEAGMIICSHQRKLSFFVQECGLGVRAYILIYPHIKWKQSVFCRTKLLLECHATELIIEICETTESYAFYTAWNVMHIHISNTYILSVNDRVGIRDHSKSVLLTESFVSYCVIFNKINSKLLYIVVLTSNM